MLLSRCIARSCGRIRNTNQPMALTARLSARLAIQSTASTRVRLFSNNKNIYKKGNKKGNKQQKQGGKKLSILVMSAEDNHKVEERLSIPANKLAELPTLVGTHMGLSEEDAEYFPLQYYCETDKEWRDVVEIMYGEEEGGPELAPPKNIKIRMMPEEDKREDEDEERNYSEDEERNYSEDDFEDDSSSEDDYPGFGDEPGQPEEARNMLAEAVKEMVEQAQEGGKLDDEASFSSPGDAKAFVIEQARSNPAVAYGVLGVVGGLDHMAGVLQLPHIGEMANLLPGSRPKGMDYSDLSSGDDMNEDLDADVGDADFKDNQNL